jgi:chemosensory pili system protein ChpA (sensor histidine kinase/response regulator)
MSTTHLSNQSLQWTRPLLDELCEEVRQAVERYGDEDIERQEGDLDNAFAACEKVAGSLAVMEFSSGQLIAEAMGLALDALRQGKSSDEAETISSILEATAILPDYLDYLESTQRDAPIVVLPTINGLRGAAGAQLLDEAQFFRPELDGVSLPVPESPPQSSSADIRRQYQHALRGILINNQDTEAMETLSGVALQVRDHTELPEAVRRAGWAAAAVCEAMKEQQLSPGPGITRLFARMDVTLKDAVEGADAEALNTKADDLARGFLFQIVMARAETPLAVDLHQRFSLAEHAPDQMTRAKVFLAGRNRALYTAVTQAAREDLARIKDALGNQLEGSADPEIMQQQTALLESVGESLAMLGLEHLAARVKAQAGKLAELGTEPDDPTLLMVARELLVVESQLEENFGLADDMDMAGDEDGELVATLLPPSEQRRVIRQLVKEALEDLAHSKHLLDAINRQKADDNAIDEARSILARIAGALFMAEFDRAGIMIESASRIAADHLSGSPTEADSEALDTLAETLTVTEFYLESLTSQDERGEQYLESARQRLENLGYWPDATEADTEPAPGEIDDIIADSESEADESPVEAGVDDLDSEPLLDEPDLDFESDELADDDLDIPESEVEFEDAGADDEDLPEPESDSEEEPLSTEPSEELEFEIEPPRPEADFPSGTSAETGASAFDDFDIVEIFLEEFDQELESLNELVPKWQEDPSNEEHTSTIRRAFHSLKGSGRMAGATEIGEFAWGFESMLNRVLDGQIEATPAVTGLIAEAIAVLPSMRARLSGEGSADIDEQACQELGERAILAAEGKLEAEVEEPQPLPPELEDLDPTLIELMVKELSDNLESFNDWLADAEENGQPAVINEPMVRIVHTMKGTMRLAPIGDESETAQILEAYLEELSLCGSPPSKFGLEAMRRCASLFEKRLARLQGEMISEADFETAELATELRELHNQAHRERTGEKDEDSPILPVTPGTPGEEAEDEESIFSTEAETEVDTDDSDLDFFDIDDEEIAAEELDSGELAEGGLDETELDEAEADETESDDVAVVEPEDLPELESETIEETSGASDELDEAVEEQTVESIEEAFDQPEETTDEPEESTEVDELDIEDEELEPAQDDQDFDEETEDAALPEDTEAVVGSQFIPDRAAEDTEREPEPIEEDAGVVHVDYSEVNEDLLEAFLEEGQELLEHSDGLLQKWREAPDDKSLVTALQRDLHTIKGSSRMVGLNPIGQVAHVMEELLEGIATGLKDTTPDRINALESGCDHLHAMIDAVTERQPMPMRSVDDIFADQAEDLEDAATLPELAPEKTQKAGPAEDDDSKVSRAETLRVPSTLIDDLVNYAGEISIFRSRLEQQISVFRNNVGEVDETVIRLRDQLRKLEIETEAQILARYEREHGPADEAFDPLELDRYSTIQQLSRALAESVNDLTSLTGILDDATRQSETLLMQQSRVNTELQEGLMQARMVSFNTLLPRFRRVVRNASREVGKKAQLRVDLSGENELDRNVLDRITAPLEHLLRNAISHGIETPDDRRQAGKPETGTISIDVSREATELVMRINDDGAGLNLDAIRKRAIEQGLLDANEQADDQSLTQMIFRPGFSTAEKVSELAGRGIGMDVVANEVRQIGGSVSAQSEKGKGARFTIRIPLSLTVMQAIMVRASDRHFAIPLQAVRGVTRILANEWLREIESSEPQQEYAGEQYPLLELEPQLDFSAEEVGGGTLSMLMIEAGEQRAALRVSELLGHREIVIKPVGPQISSIPGILGGTITGDGQVVPILDMGPLIRRAFDLNIVPGAGAALATRATEEIKRTPLVMVVDDSITMRRVTSRVLEHRGLEVVTARDGLDAVESMFERVPDLILLDIEMPRMDGYELATHVRNDPRLKELPMMMITSRSGEKHRQRAREIGVNDYLAKPYQEAELVEHVFELLKMPVPEG